MSQLGLTVVFGALAGWGLGWGVDRLIGRGKTAQVVGIFLGLVAGALGAWRELKLALDKRGERER
ncbi:MAG: AtpZ/AtpI family protein [Caldiserica bacterium]|nr:AtpZ/AtpI family protein [Caldisericota bacterium]